MRNQKVGGKAAKFRTYIDALLGGLGGAAFGSAFFIVFALIAEQFEADTVGLGFLALYAGGCGGYLFGRHCEASERDKASTKD